MRYKHKIIASRTQELHETWEMLRAKLSALEKQKIAETRAEEIFRLEQIITQVKEERQKIEEELLSLDEQEPDASTASVPDRTRVGGLSASGRNQAAVPCDTPLFLQDKEIVRHSALYCQSAASCHPGATGSCSSPFLFKSQYSEVREQDGEAD